VLAPRPTLAGTSGDGVACPFRHAREHVGDSDFRDELTTERQAAKAEAVRLRRREKAVAEAGELRDVESDAPIQTGRVHCGVRRLSSTEPPV
jgi:hypothetical protein